MTRHFTLFVWSSDGTIHEYCDLTGKN